MTSLPSFPPDSSSSSSSPSPSPPFRPFSRLPTELVQQIIESAVPLSFHSTTYRDRQNTLASLSLVSRLFRQIAQPILFAIVKLAPETQHDASEQEADNNGVTKWTQELIVKDLTSSPGQNDLEALLKIYAGLRTLAMSLCEDGIKLDQLSQLDNLSVLRLSYLQLHNPVHCTLPSLRELSLLAVRFKEPLHDVINPSAFPSLRVFSFWAIYAKDLSGLQATFDLINDQLDMVSLGAESLAHLSGKVLKHLQTKTLWDQDLVTFNPFPVIPYLRICCGSVIELEDILKLTTTIHTNTTLLPSLLYLPPMLDPSAHPSPMYRQALSDCATACKGRKVEIVYEEQAAEWEFDLAFSKDFWRRMQLEKSESGQ